MDDRQLTTQPLAEPSPIPEGTAPPDPSLLIPTHLRRPVWRLVLALAWPAMVQQWLGLVVTMYDRWLAGRFQALDADLQVASQAAQTTAAYLAWFLSSYTVLVSVGSTALVAHFIGAGDRRGARRVTNQSILLAVVLGLVGAGLGLLVLQPVLALLQLRGPAADFAASYLRPLLILLPFHVVGLAGIACLTGAGDTRTGLWVLGGEAVLNLPLTWAFFHGVGPLPGLGFVGIALGTAVSQTLGGLAVLFLLWRGHRGLRLRWRLLAPSPRLLRRLLRVSVPAALDSLSMGVGYLWFLGIVNTLGDVASAAHGIALTWEALAFLSGGAFGTAAIALVGQYQGAGQPGLAARAGWTSFAMGAAIMVVMGVLFFALARPMFVLFCPQESQQEIVNVGVPLLQLVAFSMPALAATLIFTWALRGAGDTRVPVLFTWVGFFAVRIPLAYLLTQPRYGLGLLGAWLALVIDVHLRGAFILARFASGRWQKIRV